MEFMEGIFDALAYALKSVLPLSPFRQYIDQIGELPYLGWLNWFFPVGEVLAIFAAWLTAYGGFLLYSIAMRWLKMIGD